MGREGVQKGEGKTYKGIAENWGLQSRILTRDFMHHEKDPFRQGTNGLKGTAMARTYKKTCVQLNVINVNHYYRWFCYNIVQLNLRSPTNRVKVLPIPS